MVSKNINWGIGKKSFFPLLLFVCIILFYMLYGRLLSANFSFGLNITKFVKILIILDFAFIVQRVFGGIFAWYRENIAEDTATKLDDELISLFRRTSIIIV